MAASVWVIGVDFSPGSDEAVRFGLRQARAAGAHVVLAHVCPLPDRDLPAGAERRTREHLQVLEGMLAGRCRRSRRALVRLARLAGQSGVPAEVEVVDGRPAEALAEVAARREAAVLCVGTHGHSRLARAILGSTAQRLLLVSPCPVLAVPPPAVQRARAHRIERVHAAG